MPTLLLVYVVLGIQSGLAPYVAVRDVSPNLILPVVIFIALYAGRESALLGAYIIGLMQDMLSQTPLGLHALVYATVTLAARGTQPAMHREHGLTHVLLAIIGASTHALILYLLGLRTPPRLGFQTLANFAIYTSVVTPIVLRLLIWSRRLFISAIVDRKGT